MDVLQNRILHALQHYGNGKLPISTLKKFCNKYTAAEFNLEIDRLVKNNVCNLCSEFSTNEVRSTRVECLELTEEY